MTMKLELTDDEWMAILVALVIYLKYFNCDSETDKNIERIIPKIRRLFGVKGEE